jgi:hypothetical protein
VIGRPVLQSSDDEGSVPALPSYKNRLLDFPGRVDTTLGRWPDEAINALCSILQATALPSSPGRKGQASKGTQVQQADIANPGLIGG